LRIHAPPTLRVAAAFHIITVTRPFDGPNLSPFGYVLLVESPNEHFFVSGKR